MSRKIAELKRPDGTIIKIFREELLWKLLESKELPSTPSTDVIQRISRIEHEVKKLKSLDEEVEKLIKLLEAYDTKIAEVTEAIRSLRNKVEALAKVIGAEKLAHEKEPKEKFKREEKEVPEPPTEKQLNYAKDLFFKLVKERGGSLNDWVRYAREELGLGIFKYADIYALDKKEISKLIEWLEKKLKEGE